MSEREKEALDAIIKAFPHMSEFDKGYVLGVAESRAGEKKELTKHEKTELVE